MANAGKRLDKKLKAADPDAKSARKKAGPKYLRDTTAQGLTAGKITRLGKAS